MKTWSSVCHGRFALDRFLLLLSGENRNTIALRKKYSCHDGGSASILKSVGMTTYHTQTFAWQTPEDFGRKRTRTKALRHDFAMAALLLTGILGNKRCREARNVAAKHVPGRCFHHY